MADYYTPTVVKPTIPSADMTPLERLLLTHIFDAEPDGDGLYLFSSEGPSTMLLVTRVEIEAALAASPPDSAACKFVKEQLATLTAEDEDLDLDVSGTSWEFFLQDVVRRSATLDQITVISSFTCSKMRPDGFGGMVVLITADAVKGKSTEDILCELQDDAENGPLLAAPGFGAHTLLTLSEQEVRAQIPQVIEANAPITKISAADVTDADIRAACLITVERTDLAEERGSAIFKTAVRAIHEAEQRLEAST
ncbi:MAG: hypothetical protein ACYCZX_09205 [Rhodospirillaceae bacterium]